MTCLFRVVRMENFSYSRLSCYERCPKQFYYHYVLGKEIPDTKPLALGKAVHKALQVLVDGERSIDDAIKKGLIKCGFHPDVKPNEIRLLVESVPYEKLEGETEYYFRLPLFLHQNSPVIEGYIDLWNETETEFWDYKTNWKPYSIFENHQLSLYAWAINQITGLKYIKGQLYFLRFQKIISHMFTETEMLASIKWARSLADEILFKLDALEFYPDKVNELFPYKANRYCSSCPFVMECIKTSKIKNN